MSARLRAIAQETVDIVRHGGYTTPAGLRVDIGADIARAVEATRLYLPTEPVPPSGPSGRGSIEVTRESTLEAGRRLGPGTAALVFASARNPGGGFLTGARSQEEDIARASALHACLLTVPEYYAHHRSDPDLRYTDRVIYSPDVPVFRDEQTALLDQPYRLCMLTAAAPNLGAIRSNQPHLAGTVPDVVAVRARRVLEVAAGHGHRTLVLGAWGCGVFGNDPAVVASAFDRALGQVPHFDRVVFAILDRSGHSPTYHTFADAFAGR